MAIDFDDIRSSLERVRAHPFYRRGRFLLRAVGMALLYLAMAASSLFFFRQSYNHYIAGLLPELIRTLCELLLLGLELNTVLLTFATYNSTERVAFLARMDGVEAPSLTEERARHLRNRALWCELAVMEFFFAVTSVSHLFGGLRWLTAYGIPVWALRIGLILAFLPITLLLLLYTRIEARRFWLDLPRRLQKKKSFLASRKTEEANVYSTRRLLARLVTYWVIYVAAASILPTVIPVIDFLLKLGVDALLLLPILPLLIGVFIATYYLRGLYRRARFVKRLKATCTAHRLRMTEPAHVWRSVFYDSRRGEYDFLLFAGKKTYACRILAGIKKTNNVYLEENGICTRVFALHAPARRITVTGRYAQALNTSADTRELELIRFTKEFDYRFSAPAGAQKILLFNPVPLKVFFRETHAEAELDNGMTVGEYQIYTGGAFLRMLERSLHGGQE